MFCYFTGSVWITQGFYLPSQSEYLVWYCIGNIWFQDMGSGHAGSGGTGSGRCIRLGSWYEVQGTGSRYGFEIWVFSGEARWEGPYLLCWMGKGGVIRVSAGFGIRRVWCYIWRCMWEVRGGMLGDKRHWCDDLVWMWVSAECLKRGKQASTAACR